MSSRKIGLNKFQLVGAACLSIASKKHDIVAPSLGKLKIYCANVFSTDELRRAENAILGTFKWDMSFSDAEFCLNRICRVDVKGNQISVLAMYCTEAALLGDDLLTFPLSAIVAGSAYIAMQVIAALPDQYKGLWVRFCP